MTPLRTSVRSSRRMTPTGASTPIQHLARGTLAEASDGRIVLAVPESEYRVHLNVEAPTAVEPGKRIRGLVRAQARRIDVVATGGRYLEPIFGRPRRIQGTILAVDAAADTVTIAAHDALPIVCRTNEAQRAAQFKPGQFVACDLAPGTSFEPIA